MQARHCLLVLLIAFSGCSQEFVLSNATPSFRDGYKDGCQTGTAKASNLTGTVVQDQKRYLEDTEYARGWRNGKRQCNYDDARKNPNDTLEPITEDGVSGYYDRDF